MEKLLFRHAFSKLISEIDSNLTNFEVSLEAGMHFGGLVLLTYLKEMRSSFVCCAKGAARCKRKEAFLSNDAVWTGRKIVLIHLKQITAKQFE